MKNGFVLPVALELYWLIIHGPLLTVYNTRIQQYHHCLSAVSTILGYFNITAMSFCSMVNGEDINDHHLEEPGCILQRNLSLEQRPPQSKKPLHYCVKCLYAGVKYTPTYVTA